jgi:hypothetical protein
MLGGGNTYNVTANLNLTGGTFDLTDRRQRVKVADAMADEIIDAIRRRERSRT